ncbi:MAG: ABC-ATPase domain-containing protein [Thermodesulfobacteriota bacterium]|nr:ABC-ATPase domain-containing protein [Thermodesulfobacteriota bacterium]
MQRLKDTLTRIDKKGYKAYHDIKGISHFPGYELHIEHVQGDPFASPSRVRIEIGLEEAGFPEDLYANHSRAVAFRDYLSRAFNRQIRHIAKGNRGIGKSGLIAIDTPGQEIMERTSCLLNKDSIDVCFFMGLPARGRTILAGQAYEMFFEELPGIVQKSLYYRTADSPALYGHVRINEDQDHIRAALRDKGLVAFVADNAILPRRSGIDDRPMKVSDVVVFVSPESLRVEIKTLHHGVITGAGIPDGVTLIAGGGFHGKSTLLRAIERGVYNHIMHDGRELTITRHDAVKIRSEDGRSVQKVDISEFIDDLPSNQSTKAFSTDNGSGSTSQAANIQEALELGSRLLLIDEDTSATNFMIRDERMQALISKEKEPITPFVDRVRELYSDLGCSTILVMGGSGDYFEVSDRILAMDSFCLKDVTEKAKDITKTYKGERRHEGRARFNKIAKRTPMPASFDPSRGRKEIKIGAKDKKKILFGTTEIDLSFVEQIVNISQTRAITQMIYYYALHYASKGIDLEQGLHEMMGFIQDQGFDAVLSRGSYDCALPRIYEVGAAINRMRSLRCD